MMVGKRVVYEGRVQGVGFRYTVHRLAKGFAVNGYVKNLADGTVELVVEGDDDAVRGFLLAIAGRMVNHIVAADESEQGLNGYTTFEIRH